MKMSKNLETGLNYLWPFKQVPGGYTYFDEASNKTWKVSESSIRKLGKKINAKQDDEDPGYSAGTVYSFWCNETPAKEVGGL